MFSQQNSTNFVTENLAEMAISSDVRCTFDIHEHLHFECGCDGQADQPSWTGQGCAIYGEVNIHTQRLLDNILIPNEMIG